MTLADQIAADIEKVARDAERIQALSHTQPHVFAEQKDAIARRLVTIAATLRTAFGGTPARFASGVVTGMPGFVANRPSHRNSGRPVRVEIRRRVAG